MKLSVIFVSYNVRYYLEQAIRSVLRSAGTDIPTEIFIVDNASTDDSVAYLSARFPQERFPFIHLIANTENAGFGRANNQALRQAKGEYILFLNPDTILTENTLHDCLAFAETHPDMGALGVEMLKANGQFAFESRRGLPTPWTAFCKMSGLAGLFPRSRRLGRYYMRYLDASQPAEIEIISGAFFLARKAALDDCGAFDEDFFMYGEDIDLSYRLLKKGYHNYYVPTPIRHYKGESTQKSSYRYVHVFYEAMLIFYQKHYHHRHVLLSLLVKFAILGRAALALAAGGCRKTARAACNQQRAPHDRYLFLGPAERFADIHRLARQENLDITCTEATGITRLPAPSGKTAENFTHLIFDTETFRLADILDHAKHSDHRYSLCTYYPESGLLITKDNVFTAAPSVP